MPRQCANIAARAKKKVCCTCTSVRITQQEKNSGAFTVMFKERTLFMRRKQICFYFTKAISVLFFYILTGTRCGRNTYLRFLYTRYSLDLSDWKKHLSPADGLIPRHQNGVNFRVRHATLAAAPCAHIMSSLEQALEEAR